MLVFYVVETRTISKRNAIKLQAFEMWRWRRMEKISCADKIKGETVWKEYVKIEHR